MVRFMSEKTPHSLHLAVSHTTHAMREIINPLSAKLGKIIDILFYFCQTFANVDV